MSLVLTIGIRVVDPCILGLMCTRPQSHCVLNNIVANIWQFNYTRPQGILFKRFSDSLSFNGEIRVEH